MPKRFRTFVFNNFLGSFVKFLCFAAALSACGKVGARRCLARVTDPRYKKLPTAGAGPGSTLLTALSLPKGRACPRRRGRRRYSGRPQGAAPTCQFLQPDPLFSTTFRLRSSSSECDALVAGRALALTGGMAYPRNLRNLAYHSRLHSSTGVLPARGGTQFPRRIEMDAP